VFFIGKYIKIIFFLKKLFLISAHQNDLKTPKNINLKQRKNKKKLYVFKNVFETQKQISFKFFYKIQLKNI
jgi:hypothetical protein